MMKNERAKTKTRNEIYNLFLDLYPDLIMKKITMVEVAKKIGVQRQTVARWKKEMEVNDLVCLFKNMVKRLNLEIENKNSNTEDIVRLSDSVVKIGAVIRKGGISLLSL